MKTKPAPKGADLSAAVVTGKMRKPAARTRRQKSMSLNHSGKLVSNPPSLLCWSRRQARNAPVPASTLRLVRRRTADSARTIPASPPPPFTLTPIIRAEHQAGMLQSTVRIGQPNANRANTRDHQIPPHRIIPGSTAISNIISDEQ